MTFILSVDVREKDQFSNQKQGSDKSQHLIAEPSLSKQTTPQDEIEAREEII